MTGAAALAALVAALVLWMILSQARTALERSTLYSAEYLAEALGPRPDQAALESLVSFSVPGSGVGAVAVTVSGEITASYPPVTLARLEKGNTISTERYSGVTVHMLTEFPSALSQGRTIVLVTLAFGGLLTMVAMLIPSYLRRRLLEPLRGILGQADRFEKGGGRSAEAAGASFRKLVDLLEEMRSEALRRAQIAESRSGAVLEAIDSAVVVLDEKGRPSLWNSTAESALGLGGDGDTWENALFEPLLDQGLTEWTASLDERVCRFRVTRSGSGERVLVATDITDSLAMERRFAEESALADLGALSGGVAHEIGNALCALEGFMRLLGRGSASPRTESILAEAEAELLSAKKIVESFRNMAQQSHIDSTLGCREAEEVIEGLCEDSSVIFERLHSGCPGKGKMPGDPLIMGRILGNLLSNSLRYCAPEQVVVRTGCSKDGRFVFSVEDRGPGIGDDAEKIFRPMYTTEEAKGGMGLGLTITRRLIRAMGGTITAANRSNGGAVFKVSIPCEAKNP